MNPIFRGTVLLSLFLSFTFSSAQTLDVKKWRKSERDSLDNGLLLIEENLLLQALPIFQVLLDHHPDEGFLKYSFAKCALMRQDQHERAYKCLQDVYAKNKSVPEINYEMAKAAHYNNRFDEAELYISKYRTKGLRPDEKKEVERFKQYVANAKLLCSRPGNTRISAVAELSTAEDESFPVLSADGSMMFFSYAGIRSTGGKQTMLIQGDLPFQRYLEDVVQAKLSGGRFTGPATVDSLASKGSEQIAGASHDGRTIFIFQDIEDTHGDLFRSDWTGTHYSRPVKLKGEATSYSRDTYCSLSPDGRTMYFASDRPGGYGGRDIYSAALAEDSSWVNVKNLGDSVNTQYDEDTPFMHADGSTLFFSSKGHNSIGDYDIFYTSLKPDSTFHTPVNMGCPLNTTSDDHGFVVTANGQKGYFSSGRAGGKGLRDIYTAENFMTWKPAVQLVRGNVTPNATISVSSVAGESEIAVMKGQFLKVLSPKVRHVISARAEGFATQTFVIEPAQGYNERELKIVLTKEKPPETVVIAAPVSSTVSAKPAERPVAQKPVKADGFVARNKLQEKTMRYAAMYGNVTTPGLEFYLQISAVKGPANRAYFPRLAKFGKVTSKDFGDGYTRLFLGGPFPTIKAAFDLNKRIVSAGNPDAFVIAIYKGKRIAYEELEKNGIFR